MSTYGLTRPGERSSTAGSSATDDLNASSAMSAPVDGAERTDGSDAAIALALNVVLVVLAAYCWSLGKPLVAGMIAGIPLASVLRILFNKITGI
jgi:hypothetical protein